MRQGNLFTETKTIDERFAQWLAAHPDVWELFCRFAHELRMAGKRRYGSKAIVERIRWHYATTSAGGPEFKINNDYTSRLARKLIAHDARFREIFETRILRAD